MARTVAEKMGIKAGSRAYLKDAPDTAIRSLQLPELNRKTRLSGDFDYLHLFVTRQAQMDREFPRLKHHLAKGGALWVSWPKAGRRSSDLKLAEVIRIGYSHGLVESKTLGVDADWSAIKFTRPRPGVVYKNSYGKLPEQAQHDG